MRRSTQIAVLAVAGACGFAGFAPGCRDATQMTLEIGLADKVVCSEMKGTAITVGVDAIDTESRVAAEYVTATTNECDARTRSVGTLVVTPSDDDQASVVVVVAYDPSLGSPAACKPPLFKGCIVARRRFSFSTFKKLRMPITIDPDCKDVPCDALSTCRKGNCYSSEVVIEGDVVPPEPGALPDGGTDEGGIVIPEGGLPDTGGDADSSIPDGSDVDGPVDAPTDAPFDAPPGVSCVAGALQCPGPCSGKLLYCCDVLADTGVQCVNGAAACKASSPKYCCADGDCGVVADLDGGLDRAAINGPKCNKPPPAGPNTLGTCGPPL
ncbi:MAG: hypothetical protein KF819_03610 [Labilithrix sp.]|nr:hypothetical protein [Labilithrix sp.]